MSIYTDFSDNFDTVISTINNSELITNMRTELESFVTAQQISAVDKAKIKADFELKLASAMTEASIQATVNMINNKGNSDLADFNNTARAPLYIEEDGRFYEINTSGTKTYKSTITTYEASFAGECQKTRNATEQEKLIEAQTDVAIEQKSLVTQQTAYQLAQTNFTDSKTTVMEQSRIDNILKDVSTIQGDYISLVAVGGAVPVEGDFTGFLTAKQALADRIASANGDPITTISLGDTSGFDFPVA